MLRLFFATFQLFQCASNEQFLISMLSEKVFKGQWDSNSRPLRQEPTTPTPRPPARAQNSFNFWYHAHLIDGHLRHAEVDVERLVDHEPDDEGDLNQK